MIDRRVMLAGLAALPLCSRVALAADTLGGVDRMDPALDAIIAPDAKVRRLATGFSWAEGPAWVSEGNYLLFGDPGRNIVYRWTAADGARPFLSPSGLQEAVPPGVREPGLNGLAIDAQGRLVGADSGTRAIVRINLADKSRTILSDRYEGKRFNSPNDLCIAPSGAIYFTDPPYGFSQGDESPLREVEFNGVYQLAPGGELRLVDRSLRRPNGVALSPDGRTLYVAQSDEERPEVLAYALDADGMPTDRRLFRDMRPQLAQKWPGLPDGIKVMADGHVLATGPGGVHVCTAEGKLLGIIRTGKAIANCYVGAGGSMLFLTSTDMLAAVPLRRR